MCIDLSIDDFNDDFTDMLEDVLRHIGYASPTDDEIWHSARESAEIPHIGNIYLEALLNSVQAYCTEHNVECNYYVNGTDSHLFVNGDAIHSFDDFIGSIKHENNPYLSVNQKLISAAGLEVIEDSDQEGMFCWLDSDISYENKMMAEDVLANMIIKNVMRESEANLSQEDWDEMDIASQCSLVRELYCD